MKKCGAVIWLSLCLTSLLGGCAFRQVDELYTLPKLPGDYQNLQAKIEEVTTGTGAEYSAPTGGQPVQFQDLDGDGTLEAIAFFKVTGDEKPLKIYIFRLGSDGYELGSVIEGDGTAMGSIYYENLCGSATKELVVNWQKNTGVNTLAIYSIDKYEVNELLNTACTDYNLLDIDMDNQREILVINVDTVERSRSRVDCYKADKASLLLAGSAPLSQGIVKLDSGALREGYLKDDAPIPALYVTSALEEKVVTDIFAWKNDALENITLNAESGQSSATIREKDKAKPAYINNDNVLALPVPIGQPSGAQSAPALDAWYQYDINGNSTLVYTTYHDFTEGWYFILPSDWVSKVTVTQDTSVPSEKRTAFGYWTKGEGETEGKSETFLTIYKLTGPNRHMRARLGNRFTLDADDTTIYCAEFTAGSWNCGLDQNAVKDEHFKLSQIDWTTTG